MPKSDSKPTPSGKRPKIRLELKNVHTLNNNNNNCVIIIALMLKRRCLSAWQSHFEFNYTFIAFKRQKHKKNTYIKPELSRIFCQS